MVTAMIVFFLTMMMGRGYIDMSTAEADYFPAAAAAAAALHAAAARLLHFLE